MIDRLLAAGPLSTAIRIGTNHVQRSKCKAAGRLRLDRVTVEAIFPLHQTVRCALPTLHCYQPRCAAALPCSCVAGLAMCRVACPEQS